MPFIDEKNVIQHGKFKNRLITDIIKTEPSYCLWLKSQPFVQTDTKLLEIIDSHKPNKDALTWGKFKGKSIKEIQIIDPGYITWLRGNKFVQENCGSILEQISKLEESKKN